MNQQDENGEIACQSLKILTNFDGQILLFSSEADCLVHPMVKQIIFMNIFSHMKPLLTNNGETFFLVRNIFGLTIKSNLYVRKNY